MFLSTFDYLTLLCDLITKQHTYYVDTLNLYLRIDGKDLYDTWN